MIGLGLDVCSVERIEKAMKETKGFLARYYTDGEIKYLEARGISAAQSAAAMFAAKEAFLKAMGVGLSGGIAMADVGVAHDGAGCPAYALAEKAQTLMEQKGAKAAYLSLSHDAGIAAAVCVLE